MYVHVCVYVCMCVHKSVSVYVCKLCMYISMYVHTCMYVRMYVLCMYM